MTKERTKQWIVSGPLVTKPQEIVLVPHGFARAIYENSLLSSMTVFLLDILSYYILDDDIIWLINEIVSSFILTKAGDWSALAISPHSF